MSTADVVNIKSAYDKMLEDGSAFKEVDMSQNTAPNLTMAEHGLGDKVNESQPRQQPPQKQIDNDSFIDDNTDFSHHDSVVEQRMSSLRNKMKGGGISTKKSRARENKEIIALKKRVSKLEEALILVMETHEQLIGDLNAKYNE